MSGIDDELDRAEREERPGKKAAAGALTARDIAAAKAQARANVDERARDQAIKQLIKEEEIRLQREEGFHSGDPVKDEIVSISIDLPEFSDRLIVNGQEFFHGHTYSLPRHVADSLRETIYRAWNHQHTVEGKTLAQNMNMRKEVILRGNGL